MREKFEHLRHSYKTNDRSRDELISLLLFFYDSSQDGQKLVCILNVWFFKNQF